MNWNLQLKPQISSMLMGRTDVPSGTPDEDLWIGILRLIERTVKSPELAREAVTALVMDFMMAPGAGDSYVENLLLLASHLPAPEAGPPLVMLVRSPEWAGMPISQRKAVLMAIVDLKVALPADFWMEQLAEDPEQFSGPVLAALRAIDPVLMIDAWPFLPVKLMPAMAAALSVEIALRKMDQATAAAFVVKAQVPLSILHPRLRGPIEEVINLKFYRERWPWPIRHEASELLDQETRAAESGEIRQRYIVQPKRP